MEYRKLGKTDIEVSPFTIGAWQLGGPLAFDGVPDGHPDPGKDKVLTMIHALEERGINAIDTAEQYSNGESERRVGEALKGRRERWIISSKFGYRVSPDLKRIDDSSPPTIMPSLEGSLKRLQTDYLDVYLYHCAPDINALDAGREVLEKARQQGKIRQYGISTADVELVKAMIAEDLCEVLQYPCSILEPQKELRALANQHDIGLQVRGVMAAGKLSGKYFSTAPQFKADDGRSKWCSEENFKRYAALQQFCPAGYTMAELALRWALDQPGTATICMGAKTLEDYQAGFHALEMPSLRPEECKAIEDFATTL